MAIVSIQMPSLPTTLWSKNLKGNNARFVYYYLQTMNLKRFDVGNSNPTLNRNHIHDIPVLIPGRGLQDRIAQTHDGLTFMDFSAVGPTIVRSLSAVLSKGWCCSRMTGMCYRSTPSTCIRSR